ncbi:MAG: 2'-5' RNA ligase family protein [Cyanobacteria bacterium P01_F01_bin.150]
MVPYISQRKIPIVDRPRLLIALMTPPSVSRFAYQIIQDLSDRYRTRTARVAPHITLQAPFHWPKGEISALEKALTQFKQHHAPIPIHLSGFGAFGKKVLYIQVQRSQELMAFQASLADYLAQTFLIVDPKTQQRSFSPHITVASRKLKPQTFDHAWQDLKQHSVELNYVNDYFTLLIYDGYQWYSQRDFQLSEQ